LVALTPNADGIAYKKDGKNKFPLPYSNCNTDVKGIVQTLKSNPFVSWKKRTHFRPVLFLSK
jgi:hypothetical protein